MSLRGQGFAQASLGLGRRLAVHDLHDAGDTNPHLAGMRDVLPVFEQDFEDRLALVTGKNPIVIFDANHCSVLKVIMTAIADGTALTCFAAAKLDILCAFRDVKNRFNTGAVVRVVTKRLRRTATAGAPFIGLTLLNLDDIGKRLRYDGIGHSCSPCSGRQLIAAIYRRHLVNVKFAFFAAGVLFLPTPTRQLGIDKACVKAQAVRSCHDGGWVGG